MGSSDAGVLEQVSVHSDFLCNFVPGWERCAFPRLVPHHLDCFKSHNEKSKHSFLLQFLNREMMVFASQNLDPLGVPPADLSQLSEFAMESFPIGS